MIVVDASALTAFILREEGWERLSQYFEYCLSLDLVVKETANAIWKAAHLRGLLGLDESRQAYGILKRIIGKNVIIVPELNYLDRSFEIALEFGITVYDALYLALAEERGLPILSLDNKQRDVANELKLVTIP